MNNLPLIPHLSTFRFNAIPAGLVILAIDESLTILEANQGYFDLVGYTREELRDIFENKGINTIHKDDIAYAFSAIKSHLIGEANEYSLRVRLINKDENYRTIHLTAHTEYREGILILHVLMLDLSKHYELFQQIKDEQDFNAIVNSLTEDSYFDYNIAEKSIRFSPSFTEKFSLPTVVTNYPETLIKKGLIADDFIEIDDRLLCENAEEKLYASSVTFLFENEAFHYDTSYKIEENEKGEAIRIIGKMNDVTKQFEQIESLTFISQRDQLTGLYNKNTTERLITNTLKSRRLNDSVYALFMIDADNFKSVNDTFGHLYGDIVLTQLADHLKNLFRSNDIIGRIGGDEFIVLLRDYVSVDLVKMKAEEICHAFKKTYTENSLSVQISASVGISIFPEHGTTFNELYKKADIALYNVKSSGKANFQLYDGTEQGPYISKRTELDESTLKKDFKENQIEYIFKLLYSYEDATSAVKAVLPLIMNQYNFTRCFFLESYTSENTINSFVISTNNTHDDLINYKYNKKDFLQETANLRKKGFYYRSLKSPIAENQKQVPFENSSTLFLYPIISDNDVLGVIGFDSTFKDHLLSEDELENLKTISCIIATFISKDLALKKATINEEMILSVFVELENSPLPEIKERLKEFLHNKSNNTF